MLSNAISSRGESEIHSISMLSSPEPPRGCNIFNRQVTVREGKIVISAKARPTGEHERRYNQQVESLILNSRKSINVFTFRLTYKKSVYSPTASHTTWFYSAEVED